MAADSGGRRRANLGRLTLHLGVIEQPYRTNKGKVLAITTFDVAKILESKYELFSVFERVHRQDIADAMTHSMQGALESLLMGRRVEPFGTGLDAIRQCFRQFINTREAERVGIPGTPTGAALRGVNHRLAHPYASSNPRRPSFRDTGLLETSFMAWVSRR